MQCLLVEVVGIIIFGCHSTSSGKRVPLFTAFTLVKLDLIRCVFCCLCLKLGYLIDSKGGIVDCLHV